MKRRKRSQTRQLDDWPEGTTPAEYQGAQLLGHEAVVMQWNASGGVLELVWPIPDAPCSVEHYAGAIRQADVIAVVQPDIGPVGPAVEAISRGREPYPTDYRTLSAVLGMPVPYWPLTLRIPELIQQWKPRAAPVSRPATADLDTAPLLQLAGAFADDSPPHLVLLNLAQVAQERATTSALQDLRLATGPADGGLDPEVLAVAARPTPVPDVDRDAVNPLARHAGWLEILRRDDELAIECVRQVLRWDGGRDFPFGRVVTITDPANGPAAEWASRLQPATRTAAATLVDPKGREEILVDPATDAPVARDVRGRLHAASPRRLPTTSPLAEIILDRQIWVRVADGALYPAPQDHYYGISWGYNGSGPATLALTLHRLLRDITAPAGDGINGAPPGLEELTRHPWPKGTVLTRDQVEAARDDPF